MEHANKIIENYLNEKVDEQGNTLENKSPMHKDFNKASSTGEANDLMFAYQKKYDNAPTRREWIEGLKTENNKFKEGIELTIGKISIPHSMREYSQLRHVKGDLSLLLKK